MEHTVLQFPKESQLESVRLIFYRLNVSITDNYYNAGTFSQDPYSTLGRPRKKEALVSSSINNSLNSPTRSNYELKSDFHPISKCTVTETETKIDLGSTEKSNDPNTAKSDTTTKAKDEAEAALLKENTLLEEKDKLKLNIDQAVKEVSSGEDTSDHGEKSESNVIENPSASEGERGHNQMDADSAKENTVGENCEVIENLTTTQEETPNLKRNDGDKNQTDDKTVAMP